MAVGDTITAARYNNIRARVAAVLGLGAGDEGYGQSVTSQTVVVGNTVTAQDMVNLDTDLTKIRVHQTGSLPAEIAPPSVGDTIEDSNNATKEGYAQYESLSITAQSSRLSVAPSQLGLESGITSTRTASWSTSVTHDVTITFSSQAHREAFFNAGGKINFNASRSGGSSTNQNTDWTNMLSAAGTVQMNHTQTTASSGTTSSIGSYDLTTSYQTIYEKAGSGAYSTNFWRIQGRADNATTLRFLLTFGDSHTGRGYFDSVDGTLESVVGQERPNSGTLPNGFEVTVATPTYTTNSDL